MIVSSHLATVDQAALGARQRCGRGLAMKHVRGKIRLLEVGGELLLRCCCLSRLQMLFEMQTDVETSQEL